MKRILSALLALLLTGSLILFCLTFTGRQILLPAMDKDGAQPGSDVIRQEQQLAQERVAGLARLYGFEPGPVTALVSEETLKDLHSQASRWWSALLKEGTTVETLRWETDEVDRVLASDPGLAQIEDPERREYLRLSAAEDVKNSIARMVLPMRTQTIRIGMREIGKRIDIPSAVTFLLGIPWTALALCALLTGLIVLLTGENSGGARIWIGGALGGAALVLAVLMVLYQSAGILPMIREASAGLTIQYQSVVSGALIRAGILTAAMAAGCILCLAGGRKSRKTA